MMDEGERDWRFPGHATTPEAVSSLDAKEDPMAEAKERNQDCDDVPTVIEQPGDAAAAAYQWVTSRNGQNRTPRPRR